MVSVQDLARAVIEGDNWEAVKTARQLLEQGEEISVLVSDGLTKALESLDYKCTNEEFNLLEILMAGRAMKDVMDLVIAEHLDERQKLDQDPLSRSKTMVLGTIKGDIHDLGKHIVKLILEVDGYRVVDLGKDVAPHAFVETASREKAEYIGVSSLLTVTIPFIREIKDLALETGLEKTKVIAGGAAVKQTSAEDLRVDFVTDNVFLLRKYLQQDQGGEKP